MKSNSRENWCRQTCKILLCFSFIVWRIQHTFLTRQLTMISSPLTLFSLQQTTKVYFVYCTQLQLLFYRQHLCNFLLFEVSTTVVLFNSGSVKNVVFFQCFYSVRDWVCGSQPQAVSNCLPVADQPHGNVSLNRYCVSMAEAALWGADPPFAPQKLQIRFFFSFVH